MSHILLRHRDIADIHKYDIYSANGGYDGLKKGLRDMTAQEVLTTVRGANLRGRGGAGFPAGVKWGFVPGGEGDKYVVVNADESESGTFKDRELLEMNPHQVIEGALLCAYAIGAVAVYTYLRGEFLHTARPYEDAIKEAYANGAAGRNIFGSDFSCEYFTHYGAGAYICGEETALLESLEGKLGQPRVRPPFPAQEGLYSKPTVVNNVETLSNVPSIVVNGADWYLSLGTEKSPGPKILCLSGHVRKPGNYEVMMGTTYREVIFGDDYAGGIVDGKGFKALLPSGGSGPIVTADALDAPISFEGLDQYESIMGSASLIVMDETVDMVWAAYKMIHFFHHESCGKCTPCREGCFWLESVYLRLLDGRGTEADIRLLQSIANQMKGETLCALGEFATSPVLSTIRHFPEEYRARVNGSVKKDSIPIEM